LVSADALTNVCRASNHVGSQSKYIDPSLALISLALGSVCAQDDTPKKFARDDYNSD